MRLSDHGRSTISDCATGIFGSDARKKALTLTARLQRRLGDQRIDVLVIDPATRHQPIHAEALRTGVRL